MVVSNPYMCCAGTVPTAICAGLVERSHCRPNTRALFIREPQLFAWTRGKPLLPEVKTIVTIRSAEMESFSTDPEISRKRSGM